MNKPRPCRAQEPANCAVHGVVDVRLSKRMSYVLRHNPASVGLALDANGWMDIAKLEEALGVSHAAILNVVHLDEKQRYTVRGNKIRAAQGHSVHVELRHKASAPPAVLYHGTIAGALDSIKQQGLVRGARLAVHLSGNAETARQVGSRRGDPVILEIDAAAMFKAGYVFHRSENNVWLVPDVPAVYITVRSSLK